MINLLFQNKIVMNLYTWKYNLLKLHIVYMLWNEEN